MTDLIARLESAEGPSRELDGLPPEIVRELRSWSEPDFTCAVCQRVIDCRWNPRDSRRQIPPICNTCERVSGYDWAGRARYRANIKAGSFMDRRNATRILAMADELAGLATRMGRIKNSAA